MGELHLQLCIFCDIYHRAVTYSRLYDVDYLIFSNDQFLHVTPRGTIMWMLVVA